MLPALLLLLLPPAIAAQTPKGDKPLARPDTLFAKPLSFAAPDRRAARRALSSGAIVYLAPDATIPRVEANITFRAGAYVDAPGKEGLSALVAYSLRHGGSKTRGAEEFQKELGALGATLEIQIGDTEGQALLRCEAASLKVALALTLELLRDPALSQQSLDAGKQRILASLAARDDSLDAIEARAWKRLARGAHFSTRLPSAESLASIQRQDLVTYAEHYLFPRNFLMAFSGAFDESNMVPMLEESLAGFRNRDAPLPIPPEPETAAAPGFYGVDAGRPLSTARVRVGFVGFRRDHPDRVPVQAILEYLGSKISASRLDRVLRVERGLSWNPSSEWRGGDFFAGDYCLRAACLPQDATAVARAILDELKNLGDRPLSDDALATIRQTLVDRAAAAETSAAARAARFAQDELARADAEELTRDRARLEALGPEELLRAARLWLDPNKAIVVILGDSSALEKAKITKRVEGI
jgi:zinc protease